MASTRVVAPAEQYLEYHADAGRSPNTVKSYARALALWWEFLAVYGLAWDEVTVEDFGRFLGWLRSGDSPAVASIERRPARFSEGTVALRLQAVCSLYRYHHLNGVETASRLYERVFSAAAPTSRCSSTSRAGAARAPGVVRVSASAPSVPPTLTPEQVGLILRRVRAAGIRSQRDWVGSVRDRLLWALAGRDGHAARRGAGAAALRLAHRPGGHAVRRGRAARGSPARAAGQERRLPQDLCLRRARPPLRRVPVAAVRRRRRHRGR